MGRAVSSDLRNHDLIPYLPALASQPGAPVGVSPGCAIKLVKHVAQTGSAAPMREGRRPEAGKLAPYLAKLIGWVEA